MEVIFTMIFGTMVGIAIGYSLWPKAVRTAAPPTEVVKTATPVAEGFWTDPYYEALARERIESVNERGLLHRQRHGWHWPAREFDDEVRSQRITAWFKSAPRPHDPEQVAALIDEMNCLEYKLGMKMFEAGVPFQTLVDLLPPEVNFYSKSFERKKQHWIAGWEVAQFNRKALMVAS